MAQPFYGYTNRNRVGKIGLLETDFGFHVVKITDKEDVVLLAEIVREIVPSDETSNRVFREATELEMTAKEKRDLEDAAAAANLSIKDPTQIDILDELIPGIGMQRNIVVNITLVATCTVAGASRFPCAVRRSHAFALAALPFHWHSVSSVRRSTRSQIYDVAYLLRERQHVAPI